MARTGKQFSLLTMLEMTKPGDKTWHCAIANTNNCVIKKQTKYSAISYSAIMQIYSLWILIAETLETIS